MKRKQIRFIGYCLVIGLIAALTMSMAACSSTTKLSSIAVTQASSGNLAVGSTRQFTATGTYSDSSTANITSTVTWASSNTAIATISPAGLATGVAAGSTNITAALSGVSSPVVSLPVVTP
jgi:hypothetical protein